MRRPFLGFLIEALGLQRAFLHSVKMSYDKIRMVTFKLNNHINVEELS